MVRNNLKKINYFFSDFDDELIDEKYFSLWEKYFVFLVEKTNQSVES